MFCSFKQYCTVEIEFKKKKKKKKILKSVLKIVLVYYFHQ